MEGQRRLLAEALRLATENPEAEIHVLAASDELISEYAWTSHGISLVKLGWWYEDDGTDRIFIDPDELIDHYDGWYEKAITEDAARAMMKPAILIYTRA